MSVTPSEDRNALLQHSTAQCSTTAVPAHARAGGPSAHASAAFPAGDSHTTLINPSRTPTGAAPSAGARTNARRSHAQRTRRTSAVPRLVTGASAQERATRRRVSKRSGSAGVVAAVLRCVATMHDCVATRCTSDAHMKA
jgi:hypothetical protein